MQGSKSGKGDAYRPVDKKKYDANYERIFGKEPDGGYLSIGCNFVEDFKKAVKRKK